MNRIVLEFNVAATLWVAAMLLVAGALAPAAAGEANVVRVAAVKDFRHAALHETGPDAKEAQRCFKVVDDEDAAGGQALQVRLSAPLVRQDDFAVLQTPGSDRPLDVGTYRATVRMKVQGMLNSLGSAVAIRAGDQTREVWMNEFREEDAYQEFTVDFESRPGNLLTKHDAVTWQAPGGPGDLVPRDDLPSIFDRLKLNDAPWEDKLARWIAERVAIPTLKLKSDDIPRYTGMVREALNDLGPDGLRFDEQAEKAALTKELVQAINSYGASRPDGSVALFFPKNVTAGPGATRGPATPQPTLRSLTVDWVKIEKLPEPDNLVVRQVICRYPWRRPGEEQVFTVCLHNRSGAEQANTLRLVLHSGLRHEETIWEGTLRLPDGGYQRVTHAWKIPAAQHPWGQTVIAQIIKGGKTVSEERTWFALHMFSNAVMISGAGNSSRFLHPYAAGPPATQNHRELVGANCTIYDSAGVVPDPGEFFDPYVVGNGTYFISIPTLASMTRGLAARGIAPFFYLESHGSAKRAFEIYWDHPDWVPSLPANMDCFLLQRDATAQDWLKWRRGELTTKDGRPPEIAQAGGAYSGQLVELNGIVKQNVDRVIDGSIKLCEHTDFRGVRWDGLPFRAKNGKCLGGSWGKTKDELDAISVENLRRYRTQLRAKFPGFELRANGGLSELEEKPDDPSDFNKAFEILKKDPLHVELASEHGSIMEEIWMSYAGFGNYRNDCRNYLRAAWFENSAFKMAGGHNGHMLWFYDSLSQYTPDEIYQQIFTFLGGAHLDGTFGPIPESIYDFGVYAIRFSEFFWDPALRPIRNLADKVEVDTEADLWYAEVGFEKPTDDGGLLYVIPVINPPVTELWLQNRFGLLPEPITEPFGMTVKTPPGFTKVRAVYLLDNRPFPAVRPMEFDDGGTEVQFEIPELIVFKVVAVEFGKQ